MDKTSQTQTQNRARARQALRDLCNTNKGVSLEEETPSLLEEAELFKRLLREESEKTTPYPAPRHLPDIVSGNPKLEKIWKEIFSVVRGRREAEVLPEYPLEEVLSSEIMEALIASGIRNPEKAPLRRNLLDWHLALSWAAGSAKEGLYGTVLKPALDQVIARQRAEFPRYTSEEVFGTLLEELADESGDPDITRLQGEVYPLDSWEFLLSLRHNCHTGLATRWGPE